MIDGNGRERHDFSRINTTVRIPNLIEVQRQSYNRFLQMDLLPTERDLAGLKRRAGAIDLRMAAFNRLSHRAAGRV